MPSEAEMKPKGQTTWIVIYRDGEINIMDIMTDQYKMVKKLIELQQRKIQYHMVYGIDSIKINSKVE